MPSRRSRREKNRAKKIAKLNDDCCVGESQDIEERDSFQEAHEKKKTCDRKRYKADHESKKDSVMRRWQTINCVYLYACAKINEI